MGNARTIACLVPARTDSAWFHETLRADADVYFLQGRVRFIDLRGGSQATPFSLMLVVFRRDGGTDGSIRRCGRRVLDGSKVSKGAAMA